MSLSQRTIAALAAGFRRLDKPEEPPPGDVPYIPPEMHSMNHPNRNPNSTAASPTASQVRAARVAARLSHEQAGALIFERGIRWLRFETGEARMHPAAWELFQIKTARV